MGVSGLQEAFHVAIQGSRLLTFSDSALPYDLNVLCLQQADREEWVEKVQSLLTTLAWI